MDRIDEALRRHMQGLKGRKMEDVVKGTKTIDMDRPDTRHTKSSPTRCVDSSTPKMPLVGHEPVVERDHMLSGPGVKYPGSIRDEWSLERRVPTVPLITGKKERTEVTEVSHGRLQRCRALEDS